MIKNLLPLFLVLISTYSYTQISETAVQQATTLLQKNFVQLGLTPPDVGNTIVSSTYTTPEGITMVYAQQSYKGLPVYNTLQVLGFKNNVIVSQAGSRINYIDQKINVPTALPSILAQTAVAKAFIHNKKTVNPTNSPKITNEANGTQQLNFGKLGVAYDDIVAQLLWVPSNNNKVIRLAWQVLVAPIGTDDMWLTQVDAQNGTILGQVNLTVYDHWQHNDNVYTSSNYIQKNIAETFYNQYQKPTGVALPLINGASYLVIKYPAESPIHPGGTASIHTDPWLLAPGNATSLKWHSNGTTDYTISRGNNVWATEDRANTLANTGLASNSSTPDPLTFNFPPDYTVNPTSTDFQQFAITNLFYWNNLIHDLTYIYGFNEVSGNFQANNQGRGGTGADDVSALAQSGGGMDNANFSTPNDGGRGRMRMYLWNATPVNKDGDLDNGIIIHEYTHGISNRLTGGPANSSCLTNAEQGGEGWSDYLGLMMTTNWATATLTDGATGRGIGTYAKSQATTGPGIRNYRYSTNTAINPLTYSNMGIPPINALVHGIGEIWCTALWEMTWELIQQYGINPNLFNPAGTGGNTIALKLAIEGMRLQNCNPGFVDARNGILKADTALYGGAYSCAIWKAFAKRGLGRLAQQGSNESCTDQVASFVASSANNNITQNTTSVQQGQNITYTHTVRADNCEAISNFILTDTLPTHVTYVSGGSYNASNRVVTFSPINLAANAIATYSFTVSVNTGSYFAPITHFTEAVSPTSLGSTFSSTSLTLDSWFVTATASNSPSNSFFSPNSSTARTDLQLTQNNAITLSPNQSSNYTSLSFWHRYNTEDGWDGGVVEISTNNGTTWQDLGNNILVGKYNGSLGTGSNLAGRAAFTGSNGTAFTNTIINLASFAGQNIRIRFRFASDDNTAPTNAGWWVDDIEIKSQPAVIMNGNLYNASLQLQQTGFVIANITQGCVTSTLSTPPANATSCIGGTASFTVSATASSPTYQWQVNTGTGFVNLSNDATYSGTTTATLNLNNVTAVMNGYSYRCSISNTCTPNFNSTSATLTVAGVTASITNQPNSPTICSGANTSIALAANNATSFQWQVNTGTGFVNITNTAPYSTATTNSLTITAATQALNNYQYRCIVGSCPSSIISSIATLTVNQALAITAQPNAVVVCEGVAANYTATGTGTNLTYQWQVAPPSGTFTNIAAATNNTYTITSTNTTLTGNQYRCVISSACGTLTTNAVNLTVNVLPNFTINTAPNTICISDGPITLGASQAGGTWAGSTGLTGNVLNPATAALGNNNISYTITTNGCTTTKNIAVNVSDCPERHIILTDKKALTLFPNPNNGQFTVRVNTDLYKGLAARVYQSDGKLVQTYNFNNVTYNGTLSFNMKHFAPGIYQLKFYTTQGSYLFTALPVRITR